MSTAQSATESAPANGASAQQGLQNTSDAAQVVHNIPGLANMPPEQLAALLNQLPNMLQNLSDGDAKEAAAVLTNLSATGPFGGAPLSAPGGPSGLPFPPPLHHALQHIQSGPSTHPHGPPDLGVLAGAASGAMPMPSQGGEGSGGEDDGGDDDGGDGERSGSATGGNGGRRGGRSATMSNDEWARQRKDNHKEVERRRRSNINDGITELGRIVPNGTGEKAKGAILQRAVQYIHHLKENEARNIEKWTLEKLLMDQAMGDLQAQLEEMRRMWEEERGSRMRAEGELDVLRIATGHAAPGKMAISAGDKRKSREPEGGEGGNDHGKKARTE